MNAPQSEIIALSEASPALEDVQAKPSRFRLYPKYRASGVEWLGDVPEHWEVMSIKFALDIPITDGPHETPKFLPDGIPFLSAESVKDDRLDFSKKRGFISKADHARFSRKYVPRRGDVYMIKSGATTGNVARVETDEVFNIWSPLAVLRPAPARSLTDYIFYFMKSRPFLESVELAWSYGTQQNIGMGVISNLKIALPPVPEQLEITGRLSEETEHIDTLIAKKRRLIELLKEKRTALISHAVTKGLNPDAPMKPTGIDWLGEVPKHWEIHHLRRVVNTFIDYRGKTPEKSDSGIPLITAGAIKNGVIDHSLAPDYIPESDYIAWMCRGWPRVGDVVITTEAPLAEVAQVVDEGVAFAQRVILFKVNRNRMLPEYLRLYYLSVNGKSELLTRASGSTAQGIRADRLKRSLVLTPPLPEQEAIVDYLIPRLDRLEQPHSRIQNAVDLLIEYRSALISAAVTGRIDVRKEM